MLNLAEAPARLIAHRFAPKAVSANSPKPQTLTLTERIAAMEELGIQREEKTMLSLSEAATAAGIAKSTIWRAIKAGRISATRSHLGTYEVDPTVPSVSCNAERWRYETSCNGYCTSCHGSTGSSNQCLEGGQRSF